MRRILVTALAVMSPALAITAPARADCSQEVATAVQAMGKQKFLRKESNAIGENGPFKLMVEYQIPDRMRQVLTPLTEDRPVEAIVVGDKAWTSAGDGWVESSPAETQQLITFMIRSSAQMFQEVGRFECVGTETLDGKEVRAYRGIAPPEPPPPPGKKLPPKKDQNEAVRMMYLDKASGLPARSIFARPGLLDKPIFKEIYTYPETIVIEPPKDARAAAPPPPAAPAGDAPQPAPAPKP